MAISILDSLEEESIGLLYPRATVATDKLVIVAAEAARRRPIVTGERLVGDPLAFRL